MIATATARSTLREDRNIPDLNYFKQNFPATVANLGALPQREQWLGRVWHAEHRWNESLGSSGLSCPEVVVRGAAPAGVAVEAEFDVIYSGGSFGLLHAAVLATRFGRKVMVFEDDADISAGRGWNVSDAELEQFESAGLLTKDEIASSVVNRYQKGVIKFHDVSSTVKAEPLSVSGVLDVLIDPSAILERAAAKLRSRAADGCLIAQGFRFVRAYVENHRVTVEVVDTRGSRRRFAARLFVETVGVDSPVARQIRGGRAVTNFCPTVGTVARGFVSGEGAGTVNFISGEILVSTEDASRHRQLMWQGFPGAQAHGEYTTCLFFHDAADSEADKSLLSLFEHYFETLASYKRKGAYWRVTQPVFGYTPVGTRRTWRSREPIADYRVLLLGDAAGQSNSWFSSGVGRNLSSLYRQAHLTHLALDADMLDANALTEVAEVGRNGSRSAPLTEFLRPTKKSAPAAVNETLNALMAALHSLDERIRLQLFQDRLTPGSLKSVLSRTVKLYPRMLARIREHLGARGTFWWLADFAESVWSERRATTRSSDVESNETAAVSFSRQALLYRKGQSPEDHD